MLIKSIHSFTEQRKTFICMVLKTPFKTSSWKIYTLVLKNSHLI